MNISIIACYYILLLVGGGNKNKNLIFPLIFL